MRHFLHVSVILGLMTILSPSAVRADSLTTTFSVTIEPPANVVQFNNFFTTTAFNLFNPTDGTLNSVSIALSGPADWTSDDSSPNFQTGLGTLSLFTLAVSPTITTPGSVSISMSSGTITGPFFLGVFTGSGTTSLNFAVDIDDPDTGFTGTYVGDMFSTMGLSGTITYNYTPEPSPEPSGLLLLGVGLLGLLIGRSKSKLA